MNASKCHSNDGQGTQPVLSSVGHEFDQLLPSSQHFFPHDNTCKYSVGATASPERLLIKTWDKTQGFATHVQLLAVEIHSVTKDHIITHQPPYIRS